MLKKLKSLFIVEENDGKTQDDLANDQDKIQTAPEPDTSEQLADVPETQPQVNSGDGRPDSKFVNVLLKAIDAADLDGFDYLEYKQSLQSLSKMDMDEKTRYQSAFAMAKTMGATPKSMVSSAQHYLKVLDDEQSKFNIALEAQREKQVGSRQAQLADLETSISQKKKKIQELSAQIEAHQQELGRKQNAITEARTKVEHTNRQFHLAYQSVSAQIRRDLERIKSYLK